MDRTSLSCAWLQAPPQADLQLGRLPTDFYVEPQRKPPRITYVPLHTYIHTYIHTYVQTQLLQYVMYVYELTYTHTHIHTYIHTCIHRLLICSPLRSSGHRPQNDTNIHKPNTSQMTICECSSHVRANAKFGGRPWESWESCYQGYIDVCTYLHSVPANQF